MRPGTRKRPDKTVRPGTTPSRGARWLCGVAMALLPAAPTVAQRLPAREVPRPVDFAASQDDNLFSLGRSQEDIHQFETALAEFERGQHALGVERLHRLLQQETGGVLPVAPGRFVGLRLAVVATMANLPPAAVDAYEALVRREAGAFAERPLHALAPDQQLLLAERFPTAEIGRRARVHLGDVALERGAGREAASHYRAALDAAPIGSDEERRLAERLFAAEVLAEPRAARAALARRTLPDVGDAALEAVPATADPLGHGAIGGGADGRTPMAMPAGQPRRVTSEEIAAPGFDRRRESGLFAMHAVGDLDGIYVNTGRELIAFDPLRRSVAWLSSAPLRDADPDGYSTVREYEDQINPDMVLAAACDDDVVVAALQVPERSTNVDFQGSFRILFKIPQRRLFAFSRSSGKLLWAHFDEIDGQRTRRFRGHDSCGPPVIVGDTVYAPVLDRSGAIAFAIAAYDLATGRPKWRRLVCSSQQDVNMFGNARSEFAASPLCVHEGVLYGTSNLGVTFALELATGRTRWISAYRVVQMPRTMLHGQRDRVVYFANNAPVVADRVLCTTPLDSQFVLGFDCDTGAQLWQLPAEASADGDEHQVRWLVGAFDDEFLLHGNGAVAVRARPDTAFPGAAQVRSLVAPSELRERGDGRLPPRGACTGDHVWFATPSGIRGFDRNGDPSVPAIPVDRYLPGNLLFVDGAIVSLRQRSFDVLLDAEALQTRVEQRLAAAPDDPAAILRAASLRAALLPPGATPNELARVQELYQRGLDACARAGLPSNHPVRRALQRELFSQSLARAEAAVVAGDRRALELLLLAREAAPDARAFVHVQALVLANCPDDAARRRELDLLEERAAQETIEFGGSAPMPVRAFVLWQRAVNAETPATAVRHWQALLEIHGELNLGGQRAATLAEQAIAEAIAAHGPEIYTAVAQRADHALASAGEDPEALRDVSARFPNSAAAGAARARLLDRSVRAGDLSMACEVLAQDLRSGAVAPGTLRRVAVAARAKGNLALGLAMLDRLAAFDAAVSDWPDDRGATYAAVRRELAAQFVTAAPATRLDLPHREIVRLLPRSSREPLRLLPTVVAEGFVAPADAPLYALGGAELLAFDLAAPGPGRTVLFRHPVQFLEHAVLCGPVLVVPDLERVVGLDHRSGKVLWELPNPERRIYDGLGVTRGVLHLSAQSTDRDGGAEFVGIEPISGARLFARPLPGDRMRPVPRPTGIDLLAVGSDASGDAVVERLDPVTGAPRATATLASQQLLQRAEQRADGLLTRLFPQGLFADAEFVYVPIDSSLSGDVPRLLAFDAAGKEAWAWRGSPGRRLVMAAMRGDRVVVVEGADDAAGNVVVLSRRGEVLRSVPIGRDAEMLNWQRGWLVNPAPPVLAIADRAVEGAGNRQLVCIGIDDGQPSFLVPLGNEDGEIERQPLFGDGFVTFGVRPAQRGSFRLYCLSLADRAGMLEGGRKSQLLRLGPTFGVTALGAYTVVSGADCLLVLGSAEEPR